MKVSRRRFLKACGISAAAIMGTSGLSACGQEDAPLQDPSSTISGAARLLIAEMSIEEKVAQLFFITPEQLVGAELVTGSDQLQPSSLQIPPPGGIIFFAKNLLDAEQALGLLSGVQGFMQGETPIPLFLGVDEEGGPVQRIGGRTGFDAPFVSSMSEIGATAEEEAAREVARILSSTLKALGFNTDFAPSCDIASTAESAMRERSFGAKAELVSRMVAAVVETFDQEDVLCCAKHFPGIGDPEADSHEGAIYSNKTREELEDQLMPFVAAIDAGVPFVMVGHLSLPQITGNDVPASISPEIVQGILREDLGYEGVVLTDSLSMGALSEFCPEEDRGVAAIEAGCDFVLMPPDLSAAYVKLLDAVSSGRITEERIDASLERILTLKLRAFPELFSESVQEIIGYESDSV